jgi:succinyl-CoA synthetase beta subunit
MEKYGVTVQRGRMASTPTEAAAISREILKANPKAELILKAQIHAGGRGKGHFDNGFKGGVKICTTCVGDGRTATRDTSACERRTMGC